VVVSVSGALGDRKRLRQPGAPTTSAALSLFGSALLSAAEIRGIAKRFRQTARFVTAFRVIRQSIRIPNVKKARTICRPYELANVADAAYSTD
jgi:hypothetical protein